MKLEHELRIEKNMTDGRELEPEENWAEEKTVL